MRGIKGKYRQQKMESQFQCITPPRATSNLNLVYFLEIFCLGPFWLVELVNDDPFFWYFDIFPINPASIAWFRPNISAPSPHPAEIWRPFLHPIYLSEAPEPHTVKFSDNLSGLNCTHQEGGGKKTYRNYD